MGFFIDFTGAFDNISWTVILKRLVELGTRDIGIWSSDFKERQVTLFGQTQSVTRGVSQGSLQGSICGLMIWNVVMDTLLKTLYDQGSSCIA